MGFRYQDYFDVQIKDPQKRKEFIAAINWLANHTNGEVLEKIVKAKEIRGGKIAVYEGPETGVPIGAAALQINFEDIKTFRYADAEGRVHPFTLKRTLAHEMFHLADEKEATFFTPDRRQEILDKKLEGLAKASQGYDEEKDARGENLGFAVRVPHLFSRSEAMNIAAENQLIWHKDAYLTAEAIAYYNESDLHKHVKEQMEHPALRFENHILQTYAGQSPRRSYEEALYQADFRKALLPELYTLIDQAGFPVNPEPAMDAPCGISGEVLQKINRGEMTLAQAGITLDADETLPDQHEGCLVVAPPTPTTPESTKERNGR